MERTMTRARAIAKIFFISSNPFQKFVIASEPGNEPWYAPRKSRAKNPAFAGVFERGEIMRRDIIPRSWAKMGRFAGKKVVLGDGKGVIYTRPPPF
ncbi:MAG: hypothetical protein IKU32_09135, partial [Clostridia bacterium]|nr:hypothetical protein [Clostridia bacterium]